MASIFSDSDDDISVNNPSPNGPDNDTMDIYKSIKTHIEKTWKKKFEKEKRILETEYRKKSANLQKKRDSINKQQKEITAQQKALKNEYEICEKNFEIRENSMRNAQIYSGKNKMVSINLGGEIFYSMHSTLATISPFFGRLLSDAFDKPTRDKDGNIFIDMPSIGFKEILNWARFGKSDDYMNDFLEHFKRNSKDKIDLLEKTMNYFGITYNNTIIEKGKKIQIYWRGDKTLLTAEVLSSKSDYPKIVVKYEGDGEIWEYSHRKIQHKLGFYSCYSASSEIKKHCDGEPLYWHYGKHNGAKRLDTFNEPPQ
jgi:hypothetical protein